MNLAQSGYHLLIILSVADGQYEEEEGKIIMEFLQKHYDEGFDMDAENKVIKKLKREDIAPHFKKVANAFYKKSNEQQREDLIRFAIELVTSDKEVSAEENKIVTALAKSWGVDLRELIRS